MREDFFSDRKDLHTHIEKSIFKKLLVISYPYGLTIQEIMNEFCTQIANEKPNAIRIIEECAVKKAELQLGRKLKSNRASIQKVPLQETDVEVLYGMIEKQRAKKDENDDKT